MGQGPSGQGAPGAGADKYVLPGVKLSSTDHSANDPHALAGYPLDIQLQSNWPVLDDPSIPAGGTKFSTTGMRAVAKVLTDHQGPLSGVQHDMTTALAAKFGPSTWVQAANLQAASKAVADAVNHYNQLLVANLGNASDSISGAADGLDAAEHNAKAGVQGSVPGSATAGG
jgi:hypothetical protein